MSLCPLRLWLKEGSLSLSLARYRRLLRCFGVLTYHNVVQPVDSCVDTHAPLRGPLVRPALLAVFESRVYSCLSLARGRPHDCEFCDIASSFAAVFLLGEASFERLHSCSCFLFFFDLALCLVVSGHASTQTYAQGSTGLHVWWSLSALFCASRTSGITFSAAAHDCSSRITAPSSLEMVRRYTCGLTFGFFCTLACFLRVSQRKTLTIFRTINVHHFRGDQYLLGLLIPLYLILEHRNLTSAYSWRPWQPH